MNDQSNLISTLPPARRDYGLAAAVVCLSALVFAAVVPFAKVPLTPVAAFIPSYQAALVVSDLVTAVLLFGQFATSRSRALLFVASAYLFTALIAVVHALTFPGLFSPTGLLGATPQTTAWLYMFWHGGFPLLVAVYALLKNRSSGQAHGRAIRDIAASIGCVIVAVAALSLLATAGSPALPGIMAGNTYSPVMLGVVSTIWVFSLASLALLWRSHPRSVLDLWLMVVMFAWLLDIALSVILNGGRFDLGFYAGRVYGFCAAIFVLLVLLLETGALYAQLARLLKSERELAAAKISHINANLTTLVDSSPLPIFSLDADGRVASWNSAAERVFGYAERDAIGQIFAKLPQNDGDAFAQMHAKIVSGSLVQNVAIAWRNADRPAANIVYSGGPVRELGKQVSGAVYVAEDVTEKQKLETQLAQSQKMEAVGQLTGGIAHDFNNILTAILSGLDILQDLESGTPQFRTILATIDDAAMRAAELTRHLLAFARKQPLQPRIVDVNALIENASKLLHATLGARVEVATKFAEGAWPALIDPSQLTSAILNLSINARDAMPNGGRLTIETRNIVLDEDYAKAHREVVAGPYVMVAVSDNGTGIPAAIIDKVFEPFFTTKGVGKGTGLGLSMVFGFVKQSAGHIKIYSEEGHGTSIKMYLPRAQKADIAADEAPLVPQQDGSEIVLVVEDNDLVRKNVVAQLQSLGYRTLVASSGAEGLALIETGARIDLLFTDLVMPGGMSGRQLAELTNARNPAIKVLFTSGYAEQAVTHHERLDPGVLLLGKPYRKADLARMVRQALAA